LLRVVLISVVVMGLLGDCHYSTVLGVHSTANNGGRPAVNLLLLLLLLLMVLLLEAEKVVGRGRVHHAATAGWCLEEELRH
jgi:cell shape-determining protein MreD